MKIQIILCVLAVLCASLIGCGSVSSVEPFGGGYEEVTYTQQSFSEPETHQITLQYQKAGSGRIMIWPSEIAGPFIKNDIAVFVGDKAWKQPESGERWPMKPRLFAVRSPELPLDITDEVLWRWSKQSGEDFPKLLKKAYISFPQETNNILELHVSILSPPDWPVRVIPIDWNQISDIMREVKDKGVVRKDLRWGTSYIEKKFKPEVQN